MTPAKTQRRQGRALSFRPRGITTRRVRSPLATYFTGEKFFLDPSHSPDCVKTPFMVRLGSPRTDVRHYKSSIQPFALSFVEGLLKSFHTICSLGMTGIGPSPWRPLRSLRRDSGHALREISLIRCSLHFKNFKYVWLECKPNLGIKKDSSLRSE